MATSVSYYGSCLLLFDRNYATSFLTFQLRLISNKLEEFFETVMKSFRLILIFVRIINFSHVSFFATPSIVHFCVVYCVSKSIEHWAQYGEP